jgi:hypothetical protein
MLFTQDLLSTPLPSTGLPPHFGTTSDKSTPIHVSKMIKAFTLGHIGISIFARFYKECPNKAVASGCQILVYDLPRRMKFHKY